MCYQTEHEDRNNGSAVFIGLMVLVIAAIVMLALSGPETPADNGSSHIHSSN